MRKIRFRTNVDVAKPFMDRLSIEHEDAEPLVGDKVVVLKERNKVVEMRVVDRTWDTERVIGQDTVRSVLVIELHLTSFWSKAGLSKFEAHVKGNLNNYDLE